MACAALGLQLFVMYGDNVPTTPSELEGLARLWSREATLRGAALYLDATAVDQSDQRVTNALTRFAERLLCLSVGWRAPALRAV